MKNKLFYLASLALTVMSFAKATTTEAPKAAEVQEVVTAPGTDAAATPSPETTAHSTVELPPIPAVPSSEGVSTPEVKSTEEEHHKGHSVHGASKKSKKNQKKKKKNEHKHHSAHAHHHRKHKDLGGEITDRLNHEAAEAGNTPASTPAPLVAPSQPEAPVSITEVDIIQAN